MPLGFMGNGSSKLAEPPNFTRIVWALVLALSAIATFWDGGQVLAPGRIS